MDKNWIDCTQVPSPEWRRLGILFYDGKRQVRVNVVATDEQLSVIQSMHDADVQCLVLGGAVSDPEPIVEYDAKEGTA